MVIEHPIEPSDTSFKVGNRFIGTGKPVFVIAEVGVNHHGDAELCAKMIEAAAISGADAVKLQTIDPNESYVAGTASFTEFKGKELTNAAMKNMMMVAERMGVVLFSTPGDFSSLARMIELGMPAVKISSGLLTNQPLIAAAAQAGLPLIISTGLAYEEEIACALETARNNHSPGIAVLKCTALYPAPDETVNLTGIVSFASRFCVPIGYSDHTLDELACLSAVALGATVIEKHFTLDKYRAGADHHISAEPDEFARMVTGIRRLEKMRGDGRIVPVAAEIAVREHRHRCLVARIGIAAGDVFTHDNVALKRPLPGTAGLTPTYYELVLGKRAVCALKPDQSISLHHVSGLV